MTKILGLDVSSSTIGWGILDILSDKKIEYVSCGYIKPPKKGNIIERLSETRKTVQSLIELSHPDEIVIEDIIQFMSGKSTAKTIITLTSFNRMIGLLSLDYLNRSPKLFNVVSIRHGLKINKIIPKKEHVPELISHHLGIKFPYEMSKKGKIKMESYDKADGVAVALYYALILTNRINLKGKKK